MTLPDPAERFKSAQLRILCETSTAIPCALAGTANRLGLQGTAANFLPFALRERWRDARLVALREEALGVRAHVEVRREMLVRQREVGLRAGVVLV